MSRDLFVDLDWLPSTPGDFNQRVRGLKGDVDGLVPELRRLAAFALNESELIKLASIVTKAIRAGTELPSLTPIKLAIVSNATTDFLIPPLVATFVRYGFALNVISAPYGQVIQDALDPTSAINVFAPDLILCAVDHRGLPLQATPGDAASMHDSVNAAIEYIETIRGGFEKNGKAICIFQTLARPVETLFGSLDMAVPGTWRVLIETFNRRLVESIAGSVHLLLDTAGIAETVGLGRWHDPQIWNLGKIPFSTSFLPLFADHVGRLVAAWRGKGRRCLVLDLDNTVWGGVIGDDGIDNILVAEGDATGEAHLDVQRTALALRARGIVLAVSSKNDDSVARSPFKDHAEMLLREHHIAVFQANWQDKATNIKAISEELALGLESLAFLDDNPAERGLVRDILPSVAVPELPDDPALFSRYLIASGIFETAAFSEEDKQRAEDYQSNAQRVALKNTAGNIEEYLQSLDMEITFRPFDSQGRSRISQLINKSNQFNLTTRRYSEADLAVLEADPEGFGLQVRLKDKFADNGMISVIICRKDGDDWLIDTWLMSCRVLGRRVEQEVLAALMRHARLKGISRLKGIYKPTERNSMVMDHYRKLGFDLVEADQQGETTWRLPVRDPAENVSLMRVNDFD